MAAPAVLAETRLADPGWQRFVAARPAATAFHHPAWAALVADCYGYRASALTLSDGHGAIVAGLPLVRVRRPLQGERAISLPFTDHCPPLARDAEAVAALARAAALWPVRADVPPPPPLVVRAAVPAVAGWTRQDVGAVVHTLALGPDATAVYRRFKRTQVQQRITKAEREGVTVRRGESFADLGIFYGLHLQTRRRLGVPVQPLRFFRLLWERLMAPGLGFVLLAYRGGTPISGAVFLAWNGTMVYKYSASDPNHWLLRPNNLVLWTAIRWGCDNGFHTFDFGRTDLDNDGLRAFKKGWGATEQRLVYSALRDGSPAARAAAPGPLGAARRRASRTVTALIQKSPPWVCRALGEAFYRYAA